MADNNMAEYDTIRKAWKAGKKQVKIGAKLYTITKYSKHVKLNLSDGTSVEQDEHWLVARPADGSQVPTYNVALSDNSRVRERSAS